MANAIQVTKFPQPVAKIIRLSPDNLPQDIIDAMVPLPNGSLRYTKEEINELLKKHNLAFETVYTAPDTLEE